MSRVITTTLHQPLSRCYDFLGALRLIPYVFDELGAVGIAVSSSYGSGCEASKSVIIVCPVMGA
jgi:hypothetical protein